MIFVMVKCGVLFEVGAGFLNNIYTSFAFKGLNLNSVFVFKGLINDYFLKEITSV
jgi:hypothetical protein